MKKVYFLMAAAALVGTASMSAKTTWNTQKLGVVEVDTIYHAQVGPGTTQTQIRINYGESRTSVITYSTVDLTNPYVTLKVGMASKAPYGKPQRINAMMADRTSYMNHYMAGINGDFAGLESTQSIPCGAVMEDGKFVTPGATLTGNIFSNYLVVDKDGKPQIAETISFSGYGDKFGTVTYPDGTAVNKLRNNTDNRDYDYLISYNEFCGYGKSSGIGFTGTNEWGMEAELIPVGENITYGNEAEFTVGKITAMATGGNMKVPRGGLVLSGTNAKEQVTHLANMEKLKAGDIVKIKHEFTADGKAMSARELIGGFALTVKNGTVQDLPAQVPSDIAAKTPRARTAVGYNADKTKFIMAVVQEESTGGKNGMRIIEFGDVMASLGCADALNLDGGGSSVMFVENLGQRSGVQGNGGNGVSSYTRPVANGLFAVNKAPEDGEVASIAFVDRHVTIKPGRGYQPVIYAYNQYGTLISAGLQNYKLSAPEATFDASGRKMIAPASGKFTLTATYNGHTASIPVYVDANGIDGADPATAPEFKGDEFVPVLKDPNAPIAPEDRIFAELEDVTPEGYDFDKYEAGTKFPVAELSAPATVFYTTPATVWNDDDFDAKKQISAIVPYPFDADSYNLKYENYKNAYTIQDLGGYIGKCLVFNRQWGPGTAKGWAATASDSYGGLQLSFYSDKLKRNKGDQTKAMRVRIVFQVLKRARQDYNAETKVFNSQKQIGCIYATANNGTTFWALGHDGIDSPTVGNEYPIYGSDFYRWENEGTTIATMPEEKKLQDWMGKEEPWDGNGTANPYCINAERFMVYEFDCYSNHDGAIGVHINIGSGGEVWSSHNSIVIKEVKFFNILNGEELLTQPRADKENAPAKVANIEKPFENNTAYGSLLNTRHISYRYYTEEGVKEIAAETSGIEDVIEDSNNDAPVEYYNLQGIRVNQPAPGQVYIKRQGSSVSKVLVR